MQKHASRARLPLPRLRQGDVDQPGESIVGPCPSSSSKIERSGERFDHRIERPDVTPEESTDDLRSLGTAAAFGHFDRRRSCRHLPEESQHRIARQIRSQARGTGHQVPVSHGNDEHVAGVQPHRRVAWKRRPARTPPDDVIRHDVLGAGQHDGSKVRRVRDSWTHGEDTSIGKNNAPVSLTVRRTSDRTSTVAAGESVRPVAAWMPGRQRGRSVMASGHGAILHFVLLRRFHFGVAQ